MGGGGYGGVSRQGYRAAVRRGTRSEVELAHGNQPAFGVREGGAEEADRAGRQRHATGWNGLRARVSPCDEEPTQVSARDDADCAGA